MSLTLNLSRLHHDVLDSRAFVTASYRSHLRTYIHSSLATPPPQALLALLSSPRARILDLSYIDDASGTTLLHEAARRKDLTLIELAVRGGADVFVRDRRGRTVSSVVGKDDKVRVFLRQCTYLCILFRQPRLFTEYVRWVSHEPGYDALGREARHRTDRTEGVSQQVNPFILQP